MVNEERNESAGMSGSMISKRELFYMLFRHRLLIVLTFLIVAGGATLYIHQLPWIYQSEARIRVQPGREAISPDMMSEGGARSVDMMNAEQAILQSRNVIEAAVDRIGAEKFFGGLSGLKPEDTKDFRENAIEALGKGMDVVVKGNIFTITYTHTDPRFCQQVLTAVVDSYTQRHLDVNVSKSSLEFFDRETKEAQQNLEKKEKELADLQATKGLFNIAEQKTQLLAQINESETGMSQAEIAIKASEAKIASLQSAVKGRERFVERPAEAFATISDNSMQARLIELRVKEAELTNKYPDDSVPVKEIRNQIQIVEAAVGKSSGDKGPMRSKAYDVDATRQSMDLSLENEQVDMKAQKARYAAYQALYKEKQQQLAELNEQAGVLTRLQRESEVLEGTYREYRDNLVKAQKSSALDRDKVSNVTILQSATFLTDPVAPRKGRNIMAAWVGGFFLSLALAFLREYLDQSLKSTQDVEKRLGLPVLASVSHEEFKKCI